MKTNLYNTIFSYVKSIPKGRVSTYGLVANNLRPKIPKINGHIVGWVLHKNKTAQVPCHRVVDRTGRLAPGFAFDGPKEQKRRLEYEGVTFLNDMHVNLEKHIWKG
jgi:methylated-DNA-protein-cysteine methyltransferase related protein